MSRGNLEHEIKAIFELKRRVVVATATVRTGRAADTNIIDMVIDIDDAADDFTLTVPDGTYMGQQILIVMSSNTNSKTCTVSVTSHVTTDPEDRILDAADETLFMLWTGTEWVPIYDTGSDS